MGNRAHDNTLAKIGSMLFEVGSDILDYHVFADLVICSEVTEVDQF